MRLEVDDARGFVPYDGHHSLAARAACAQWVELPTVTPDGVRGACLHAIAE